MKKYGGVFAVLLVIASCGKENNFQPAPAPHPPMEYTDLNDETVKFGEARQIDINGDGINDIAFTTMIVGDPIERVDKRRYYVNAAYDVFSLVNEQEQTPVLKSNDAITIDQPAGYNWYNASSLVLAEKIIEETAPPHWEGNWKNARHNYLAVQVRKNNVRYNGWVELSFKTDTEEFVLHRAGVSKEAGKDIRAGK